MDCDLQDQPEEVPAMLAKAMEGGFDAVRARRTVRNDSLFRRVASRLFYSIFSFLTDTHQSAEIANFGVYHRKVIAAINRWQEELKYFPATVEWVGFSQATLQVVTRSVTRDVRATIFRASQGWRWMSLRGFPISR